MATVAGPAGKTFGLPQDPFAPTVDTQDNLRIERPELFSDAPGLDTVGPLQTGLEDTDFETREYYSKFANIRSFVRSLWKNHGIDVTAPDFSDPAQQRLHTVFLKSLADMQNQGNRLKRSQENFQRNAAAAIASPDVLAPEQTGDPTTELAQNIGPSTTAKIIAQQTGRNFARRSDVVEQDAIKAKALKTLNDKLAEETNPIRQQQLQNEISVIEAANPAQTITLPRAGGSGASVQKTNADRSELFRQLARDFGKDRSSVFDILEAGIPDLQRLDWVSKEDGRQMLRVTRSGKRKGEQDVSEIDIQDVVDGFTAFSSLFESVRGAVNLDLENTQYQYAIDEEGNVIPHPQAGSPFDSVILSGFRDKVMNALGSEGTNLGRSPEDEQVVQTLNKITSESPLTVFVEGEPIKVRNFDTISNTLGNLIGIDTQRRLVIEGENLNTGKEDEKEIAVGTTEYKELIDEMFRLNSQQIIRGMTDDQRETPQPVPQVDNTGDTPSFSTPEEAMASDLPDGTLVSIGGRLGYIRR